MDDEERAALKASLAGQGQVEKVVLLDGMILDGRNRDAMLRELGVEPETTTFAETGFAGTPAEYVRAKLQHRHLTPSQKACVAVANLPQLEEEARARIAAGVAAEGGAWRKSAQAAADAFGVSVRYVEQAKRLQAEDPTRFRWAFDGRSPERPRRPYKLSQAISESRRAAKAAESRAAVAGLPPLDADAAWVTEGDAFQAMMKLSDGVADLIFTDPPYNIGVDYGSPRGADDDRKPDKDFLDYHRDVLKLAFRVLRDGGSLYLMMSTRYAAEFKALIVAAGFEVRRMIAWHEPFAQHQEVNYADDFRVIWYAVKPGAAPAWNPDDIRISSARQTIYGDARADPDGRVPGAVWTFPRVAGTFGDREFEGNANQLPVALVARAILASSEPGDLVCDPFSGGATTGVAALLNGRRYMGIERVAATAERSRDRLRQALHNAQQARHQEQDQ